MTKIYIRNTNKNNIKNQAYIIRTLTMGKEEALLLKVYNA